MAKPYRTENGWALSLKGAVNKPTHIRIVGKGSKAYLWIGESAKNGECHASSGNPATFLHLALEQATGLKVKYE